MKSLTDPKYYHQLLGKRKSFILDPIFTAFEISTTEIGTKKNNLILMAGFKHHICLLL